MCNAWEKYNEELKKEGRDEGRIIAYYEMGRSITDIAEHLKVSTQYVLGILKEEGLIQSSDVR